MFGECRWLLPNISIAGLLWNLGINLVSWGILCFHTPRYSNKGQAWALSDQLGSLKVIMAPRPFSAKVEQGVPFLATPSWFYPWCSMYGIFTYIGLIFGVNVGKYSIHGAYGYIATNIGVQTAGVPLGDVESKSPLSPLDCSGKSRDVKSSDGRIVMFVPAQHSQP